jgi:hypothetical protein
MSFNPIFKSLIKIGLVVVIVVLAYLAGRNSSISVQADGGKYSYLAVQAGDATPQGGKEVVDMRNGNLWICTYQRCTMKGPMPFDQIMDLKATK